MTKVISVIVAVKNEEKNLGRLLTSLKQQTYSEVEIIVVDNSSIDKTKEIAKEFKTLVFDTGPERSAQRNFGAKQAKGDFLVFLDADMELDNKVLEECMILVKKNSEVKGVIIPEESVGQGFWAEAKRLERLTYVGDDSIEAARFFDKKAFFEVKGYDEELIAAEDWDLQNRFKEKGYQIGRINSKITHHEGNLKFFFSIKKKFYYGKNIRKFLSKKRFNSTQVSPFRSSYFRHYKLFLAHPVQTMGFLILKTGELSALSFGLLLSYFKKS